MRHHWIRTSILLTAFLAAVAAGYSLSSSLGQEVLRQELEAQLTRIFRSPVEIERARISVSLDRGVQIEGHGLSTYPDADGSQLTAQRALVRLNVASLVLGRLSLRRLLLDGAVLRIHRPERGDWTPLPLASLTRPRSDPNAPGLEGRVRALRAFEGVARFFLEWGLLARQVELRRGSVVFLDSRVNPDTAPLEFRLQDINGLLVESWISGQTELSLQARWVGSANALTPFEVEGRRASDGSLHFAVATTEFDLHPLLPYAAAAFPQARLAGRLSGVVTIDTPARDHTRVEFDWMVNDLDAVLRASGDPIPYRSERAHLESRIELHPGRLRLSHGELLLGALKIEASGHIDRPIRESSQAQLDFTLRGAGTAELESFVRALPRSDREVLLPLIAPIVSGEIVEIGGSGGTDLSGWRQILSGNVARLPESFRLEAEVADVSVGGEGEDRLTGLTGLGGRIEWRSDRIHVRDARAMWNGKPLPTLNASIDGLDHLLASSERDRELQRSAVPLEGLRTAWEFLTGGRGDSASGEAPHVELTLDEVHHPFLLWPIRDSLIRLKTRTGGVGLALEQGLWAGAAISGRGEWLWDPSPRFDIELTVEPRLPTQEVAEPAPLTDLAPGVWLSGGVELISIRDDAAGTATDSAAYSKLRSEFSLRGSSLEISDVYAQLLPTGVLDAVGTLDLGQADRLPLKLQFQIAEGDAASLTETVGFPADFVDGKAVVSGNLGWTAQAGQPLFADLSGSMRVTVTDGQVRRSLPVVTAVANLSEGLVTRDAVGFEKVETELQFDHGRISTDRFALDGPMRVIAEGSFDPSKTEAAIDVTVGVFLMRQLDQVLDRLPLIRNLTDSNKGLFGVYFSLEGTWSDPIVTPLPVKTLAEGTLLSQVLEAPLRMLKELESIFGGGRSSRPEARAPSPLQRKGMRRPDRSEPAEPEQQDPAEAAP